jgi:hypothetical protein
MSYVREIALSCLLFCLLAAAVIVLADGPSMRQSDPASEAGISAVSQEGASNDSESSGWTDPPRRSLDQQRQEATAISDKPAED